jgi:hypothetical protein
MRAMRFMILVKATKDSEAGKMPDETLLAEMGKFNETKELVAGFWLWQVKSREEAIEWVKRCPNPMPGESEIEIRQIFEAEDFGAAS